MENVFVAIVYNKRLVTIYRHDNIIGLPGGKIELDVNENPIDAILRETLEEINFNLNKDRLKQIKDDRLNPKTGFYLYEANVFEFNNIFKRFANAEHLFSEMYGIMLMDFSDKNIFDYPMHPEFKVELEVLREIKGYKD